MAQNLEKVGPRRGRRVPSSRHKFLSFFSLSWGLLVEFWWFEAPGTLKRARLEFSGCRASPGGPVWGPTRQPRTPNGHMLQKTPPKFHEKTPKETEKERKGSGRGNKESENLAVRRRGVWEWGVWLGVKPRKSEGPKCMLCFAEDGLPSRLPQDGAK